MSPTNIDWHFAALAVQIPGGLFARTQLAQLFAERAQHEVCKQSEPQWRHLGVGERVEEGDEVASVFNRKEWSPCAATVGLRVGRKDVQAFRRRVAG